ncbi:hypothetical protein DFQ27_006859 [Actinomortierella ambigua]|uniref:LSM2-LSM8 complex subunit LSM8 n=1 Tax=Actinomortierella ambigua TaxID=1343610 RepID=A0A9P6PXU9_9FUNG|nr:hypothetical protein DFQ26_008795 [Actinomortierella ambigua]KAG0254398.1 hypothetical protein DFQ27_006859 [Actinomortierella ambigua]
MSDDLRTYADRKVWVFLTDGRTLVGELTGFDQRTNLILTKAEERIYSATEPVKSVPIGVYIIKGDTIGIIGQIDEELESQVDHDNLMVDPIEPLVL